MALIILSLFALRNVDKKDGRGFIFLFVSFKLSLMKLYL